MNGIMNINGIECYEKDGIVYLKLEAVARGLGFTQTQDKNGTEYISIRWGRVEGYLEEIGFPHKWGKGDFIPENIFYRLAMKAKNETAEKFQTLVADEIIPQIRRTGGYVETNREGEFIEKYFPSFTEETKLAMIQDLHKQNQQYKSKIKELEPQAQAYIDLMSAQGYLQFIDVAALVEIGRTKLFDFLRKHKVLTKQSNFNVPYGRFRENGMFKVITTRSATGHISNVTMVSPKGLNYIYRLLKKKDVLGELDAEPLLRAIEEKKDKGVA